MTNPLTDVENLVYAAMDYYQQIMAYQALLKSSSGDKTEVIYYYFKKPGFVRMNFVTPLKGAVLIYDPTTKQAKLWPFGHRTFPALTLHPGNSMIKSSTGQRVDRSDMGVLYQNVKKMQEHAVNEVIGIEMIKRQETIHVSVSVIGFTIGIVSRYQIWLDRMINFPLKIISHGIDGRLIEVVEIEEINPTSPTGHHFLEKAAIFPAQAFDTT